MSDFTQNILKFPHVGSNKEYNVQRPKHMWSKVLNKARLGLKHLLDHKLNRKFSDCLDEFFI